VAAQIRRLLDAGVAPHQIAVVGHSKGAIIAEFVAGMVAEPAIAYVLLGGCAMPETHNVAGFDARQTYENVVSWSNGRLQGRMLSLYDVNDEWMGPCDDLFRANPKLITKEIVLRTGQPPGKGHGLFYTPDHGWVGPALDWIVQ
jgi:acetyl esterase/lipase